jgi:predicted N-acetyltransferase YhbS
VFKVNVAAQEYYRKFGFQATSEDELHIKMEWRPEAAGACR